MKDPLWVEERDVLALHERLLSLHGGLAGLRDQALLKSALARPRQHLAYANAPDIVHLAAIYTAALVRNHAFLDGNERIGFLAGILFLERNGYRFHASEEAAAQAVIDLASGHLDEHGYAAFLQANTSVTHPPQL